MRINVTIDRLVIRGAAREQGRVYGAAFAAALEARLSQGADARMVPQAQWRTKARPLRVQAGSSAHDAGTATGSAIGRTLGGESQR